MHAPSIEISNLTKKYKEKSVVEKVALSIPKGTIYTLLGPNGAGKTTLLKMLVGLLDPTSGTAAFGGQDIVTNPLKAKTQFAYISDDPVGYEYLSGREFLSLTGKLRNMQPSEIEHRIAELLPLFAMERIIDMRMGDYSRGIREKVVFLSALLTKPQTLIIDEPIVGLDPKSITIFGESLQRFAKDGGTVLFTTHILDFAEQYADKIGILFDGKLVYEGDVKKDNEIEKIYLQFVTD